MLTATLSYCKLEIIPLQRVDSAASRKLFFILEVLRILTLQLLADSLQSFLSLKRM